MQTQTEPRVRTLCAPTLWVNWNQTKKRNTVFFPPCGVHIKSFLISSVPLSWMHARGQHVWGRTKSWWTLAVHHSSQERRTDPGAFTGLSPSHQAAASECERPHNPQSPPEPIAPSFLPSNSPLSIFFFSFFGKVREFAIVEIFFMSCVSSSSPSEVHRCSSVTSLSLFLHPVLSWLLELERDKNAKSQVKVF